MFSSDGRRWVYREGGRVHLGDADDPAAPSRLQLPDVDARGVADFQGQNRLALWSTVGWPRVQLQLYVADTLSLLGTVDEVRQAVVGARGILALTGYQGRDWTTLTPGTLLLGGLGAGRRPLVIGQNVTPVRPAERMPHLRSSRRRDPTGLHRPRPGALEIRRIVGGRVALTVEAATGKPARQAAFGRVMMSA